MRKIKHLAASGNGAVPLAGRCGTTVAVITKYSLSSSLQSNEIIDDMKPLSLSLMSLAVAALAAGCSDTGAYEITGTVEGAKDGDKVYLMKVDDFVNDTVDVAEVEDGAFHFKGTADQPLVRYIVSGNEETPYGTVVFLEGGSIEAVLGDLSYAKGTPENDLYYDFSAAQRRLQDEFSKLLNDRAACTDEALYKELTDSCKAKYDHIAEMSRQFVSEHIGTTAGLYEFWQTMDGTMTPAQIEDIHSRIPAGVKAAELMASVESKYGLLTSTMPGKPIKDFTMRDADGTDRTFSQLVRQEKLTLVDFWASWCGPCMASVPGMLQIAKDFSGSGLQIIGVSLDTDSVAWTDAVRSHHLDWLQLSDLQGWQSTAARAYNINSIPALMLVDSTGTIVTKGLSLEATRAAIDSLLTR